MSRMRWALVAFAAVWSCTSAQCAPAINVTIRQFWSDLKLEVSWPFTLFSSHIVSNQSLWILLRTGSRFPRQTAIPALNASFPDWPFDRALQLVVPFSNVMKGSCKMCSVRLAAFEGTWSRRTFPADELAWVNTSAAPVPTTVVVDDNVLGLPRNASVEWCARRSGCGSCEATGSFVFDPSFRWQNGTLALAGSHRHFCALQESRAVRCWGWNAHGQLGANHTEDVGDDEFWGEEPAVGVDQAEAVAVGWAHSCALTRSGQVWCWGLNAHGQLGLGDFETRLAPSRAAIEGHVVSIAAGGNHSCAVWANGSLACWGANAHGQLGLGDAVDRSAPTIVPMGVVRQVSVGWGHTCAVVGSGRVACWGRNDFGQLGLGHTDAIGVNEAVVGRGEVVALGFDVESVACGEAHSCALLSNGTAHCWGLNAWGQLGLGHNRAIGDDEGIGRRAWAELGDVPLAASLGSRHTCVVWEGVWLKCWGSDAEGALGLGSGMVQGDDEGLGSVSAVETGGEVLGVAAGSASTCIVRHWGSVECWGTGWDGEGRGVSQRPRALVNAVVRPAVSKNGAIDQALISIGVRAAVSVGYRHSCALDNEGGVHCWGSNEYGQLGLGHTNNIGDDELPSSVPAVSLGSTAVAVSCGNYHSCALLVGGSVRCWGHNRWGLLGLGHTNAIGDNELPSSAPAVSLSGSAVLVSCGSSFTCTVLSGGSVRCWGSGTWLGLGHQRNIGDDEYPSSEPTISLGSVATILSSGGSHTCAILSGGSVRCWGYNYYGQLGLGHTNTIGDDELPSTAPPLSLGGPGRDVSCGQTHSCALLANGQLRCWGRNANARLGISWNGDVGDDEVPSSVPAVEVQGTVSSVSCGMDHTCVVLAEGSVRCWGNNNGFQLGTWNQPSASLPINAPKVPLGDTVRSVSSGNFHSCASMTSGRIRCWGSNSYGALGLGHSRHVGNGDISMGLSFSVRIGGIAAQVSSGNSFTCAVLLGGLVRCWGHNGSGQLGLGHQISIGDDEHPLSTPTLSLNGTVSVLSCGGSHVCAVLDGGSARCWGSNTYGQLGLGHTRPVFLPMNAPTVSLNDSAVDVSCGHAHSCVALSGGVLRCWGWNVYGELGLNHTRRIGDDELPLSVHAVDVGSPIVSVSCGSSFTCALLMGGSVKCWGWNIYGQLGLGHNRTIGDDEHPSSVPDVSLNGTAVGVSCGSFHSCAVLSGGALRCWGWNRIGELGLGHTRTVGDDELPSSTPEVSVGGRVSSVSCGASHSCIVVSEGSVRCWGESWSGELGLDHSNRIGDNELPSSSKSVELRGRATSVSAGSYSSCAVISDGAVRCWGGNSAGELGLGHTRCVGRVSIDEELWETTPIEFNTSPANYTVLVNSSDTTIVLPLRRPRGSAPLAWTSSNAPIRMLPTWGVMSNWSSVRTLDVHPIASANSPFCASRDFILRSSSSLCSIRPENAFPWLMTTPSLSILRAQSLDPVGFLRKASRLELSLSTPWLAVDAEPSIHVGSFPCINPSFLNLTTVSCSLTPGRGTNLTVSITVPSLVLPNRIELSTSLSFAPPEIVSVVPNSFLSPLGNQTLRIDGLHFGAQSDPSDVLQVGGAPCDVLSFSDTVILCRTRPTQGSPSSVFLSFGGQSTSFPVSFSSPSIVGVHPPVIAPSNDSTPVSFVISGSGFGAEVNGSLRIEVGGLECASATLVSSSRLECQVNHPPLEWPSTIVSVSFGVVSTTSSPILVLLPLPSISAILSASFPTSGGVVVRVVGQGLGVSLASVLAVSFGSTLVSSNLTWISSSELRVPLPPGLGAQVPVRVFLVRGVTSEPFFFDYDRPLITSIAPSVLLAGPGPRSVFVHGSNFGHQASDFSSVTLGGVPCSSIRPLNTSVFVCENFTANVDEWPDPGIVVVNVAGLVSDRTRGLLTTINRPRVRSIRPAEVQAGEEITITGSGFGARAEDLTGVRLNGWLCSEFHWVSSDQVTCTVLADHPIFDPSLKPPNSSDVANWAFVTVELTSGVTSFLVSELDDQESLVPRVAPRTWVSAKVPTVVPVVTHAAREVGRFEMVYVEWEVDASELQPNSPSLRVTGFLIEGVASDGAVFSTFVSSIDARSGELPTSSRLPIVVTVRARNGFGDGARSSPSDPVLESCDRFSFLATHLEDDQWRCRECPDQAVCGGLTSRNVTARSGFWRVPWSAFELGFASCKRPESCRGFVGEPNPVASSGPNGTILSTRFIAVPGLELDPTVIEGCAEGHEGVLCASCTHGFFKTATGLCQPCGSTAWIVLRVLGLLILAMVLLGVLLLRAYKSAGEGSSDMIRVVKILFNHFQTIAIISSIRFQWPPSVADTFAVSNSASSFGVEGVSLECVMGDAGYNPMGRSLVSISTPIWLLLYAAAFWAVHVAVDWSEVIQTLQQKAQSGVAALSRRRLTIAQADNSAWGRWVRRMKVSVPVLIFLVHTSVTKAAFQMVTCESVAPDDDPASSQLRLSMNLETRCDDPKALEWMLGVALPVLLLFSVGVPVLTIAILHRVRAQLGEPEVKRLFGFLFFGFREGFEGWEGVNVLRKVLLAGVTVVLGPFGAFNQVGAALVVIGSFGFAHARFWPYSDAFFNRLEMASLMASCLTMIAGLFIEGSGSEAVAMYVAPTGLFVANLVFLAMVGWQFFTVVRKGAAPNPPKAGSAVKPPLRTTSKPVAGFITANPISSIPSLSQSFPADGSVGSKVHVRRGRVPGGTVG